VADSGPSGHFAESPVEGVSGVLLAVFVAEDEIAVVPGFASA
jgi:hypothetical protein